MKLHFQIIFEIILLCTLTMKRLTILLKKGFKYELDHSEDIISHNIESQRPIYIAQIKKSNKSDLHQINLI